MRNFFKILAVVILISWFAGFVFFADAINSYPEDHTTRTEAIIALTGGRNRIAEAFRLVDEGKSDRLFISGVSKHSSLAGIKHRNHITGGDDEAVSLGREATNTVENAIETSHWLKENNIKSIRLVTSNYHVPRSTAEFKVQNPELQIVIHPVYSEKVRKKWWKSWQTFSLIFSEYNKFLYVYIRSHLQTRGR